MPKRKNIEDFKNQVYNLVKNEYTVLSNYYINNKTKIKLRHNICKKDYEVTPQMFIRGRRCPYCNNKIKKTTDSFKKELKNLVGEEYIILSEYKNCKTNITFKHNKCGNKFEMRPNDFQQGQRCPYCSEHRYFKKSNEDFLNDVINKTQNEYKVLSKYKNNKTKVLFKHNKCNNIFEMTPHNFLNQNQRCPFCFGNIKKTTEEFKQQLNDLVGDEYLVLGDYFNSNTKILIKHQKCNNKYYVKPYHILNNGRRCPFCKESKGEKKIKDWLDKNNILYETQFKFSDCKYKRELPFDFKLEDDSGKIILIEYDGEQHDKGYFIYNETKFNEQKLRDRIKDDYCKNHSNIDLYRISYKDFNNIESILEDIVKRYE